MLSAEHERAGMIEPLSILVGRFVPKVGDATRHSLKAQNDYYFTGGDAGKIGGIDSFLD